MSYLDRDGLIIAWDKIKRYIDDKFSILDNIKITNGLVSGGDTSVLTLQDTSLHIVVCSTLGSTSDNNSGVYIVSCADDSSVGVGVVKASNMSYVVGQGTVTFTNSSFIDEILYIVTIHGDVPTLS